MNFPQYPYGIRVRRTTVGEYGHVLVSRLCEKHGLGGVNEWGGCHACFEEQISGASIAPNFPPDWEKYQKLRMR